MKASKIETLIRSLGQEHAALRTNDLITDQEFIELYPGIDDLYLKLETGMSMQFRADSKKYEALFFTLIKTTPSTSEYVGELPTPYTSVMAQSDVHRIFGKPFELQEPVKMPEPRGETGGWESYILDEATYPNTKVVFRYTVSMHVNSLIFTLIDTGN